MSNPGESLAETCWFKILKVSDWNGLADIDRLFEKLQMVKGLNEPGSGSMQHLTCFKLCISADVCVPLSFVMSARLGSVMILEI